MGRCWSDVDVRHYVDHEVDDKLPIVDTRWIGIPYAAGIVDYEAYVHLTCCNRRITQHSNLFSSTQYTDAYVAIICQLHSKITRVVPVTIADCLKTNYLPISSNNNTNIITYFVRYSAVVL